MLLSSATETEALGRQIAGMMGIGDVIALSGPLGAGKTTLARGLLSGLGFAGEVASPSFALVIPYAPPSVRLAVAHVDLYRIESPDQMEELGLDDFLTEGALVIEWPERMGTSLWPESLHLNLATPDDGSRILTADVPPSWIRRWLWT